MSKMIMLCICLYVQFKDNISGRNRKGGKNRFEMDNRTWQALGHLAASASWPGFFVLWMYILVCKMTGPIPYPPPILIAHSLIGPLCRLYLLLPYFQTNRLKSLHEFPPKYGYTRKRKKKHMDRQLQDLHMYCSTSIKWHRQIIIIIISIRSSKPAEKGLK